MNSVVVVGLYYGFITAFSIRSSYFFFMRVLVIEKEPNTKKGIPATTGFIMGQLMRLLSIYYVPFYLALGRPHTITALALPYLLIQLFFNTENKFFVNRSNNRNSSRNLENICIFLNHLILQLLNICILPSSTLARLVSLYMFRCNNKMLFITSSLFAWVIGQILVINCLEVILVWVRKNNFIRSIIQRYLGRNSIFVILLNCSFASLLFILSIQSLGRTPLPIPTQQFSEVSKIEQREKERLKREEERDVEKEEQSTQKDPSTFSSEKGLFEKELDFKEPDSQVSNSELEMIDQEHLVSLLFDYKRWARPFRYIKNNRLEQAVRNEMAQYFFDIHQSDGKERISFTHPISLSTFWEMIKTKIPLLSKEKDISYKLENFWISRNKQKLNSIKSDFSNRVNNLDKPISVPRMEIGTTRTRLCIQNDEIKKQYLPEKYDPLLNGPSRGRIKNDIMLIKNESSLKNLREAVMINRLHALFLMPTFEKNPLQIGELSTLSSSLNLTDSENLTKFLVNPIDTDDPKSIAIEKIGKKVPRWSYKLITELEQISYFTNPPEDHDIRSRKGISVLIFEEPKTIKEKTKNKDKTTKDINIQTTNKYEFDNDEKDTSIKTTKKDENEKLFLIRYPHQSDFRQGLIKDSMRTQRRKIVIEELLKANAHSPLFFDRMTKKTFFSVPCLAQLKRLFKNWSSGKGFGILESTDEKNKIKKIENKKEKKRREEIERLEIGEAWETLPFTQPIRGFLLITQSILRKKVLLPSLIIGKNIGRMLLFQTPEWSEDLQEWNRETHIKCTYNGIPLADKKFPENWLTEGIQIKILFPFCLKPWHQSKSLISGDDFCFLTVWGRETEHPFGHPRQTPSFFKPVLKELYKFLKKLSKEKTNSSKTRTIKPSEIKEEKNDIISNQIMNEPFSQIEKITDWKNSSPIEKMQAITDRTSTIKKKLERITEEKKRVTLELNMSPYKKSSRLALSKTFCQIFKIRKNRLICKFHYFIKLLIQRISNSIFFYTISICRMTNQLFVESTKTLIDKTQKNQNKMNFLSNIKKHKNHRYKENLESFDDLSNLSQAYVLYKISQRGILNVCNLKSVLQDHGTSLLIKNKIKDSFHRQGILQSEAKKKQLQRPRTSQWKTWLRGNSQYDLSPNFWSALRSQKQKWRNRVKRYPRSKEKYLDKWNSGRKLKLSKYRKQKGANSVLNQNEKDNCQKCYRYDLLSYQCIQYEKNSASVITSPVTRREPISYHYKMSQNNLFAITKNIPITSLRGKIERVNMPYIEKNLDRKYLNWKKIHFSLEKKVDIESWITANSSSTKNTPIFTYNYQLIDKMEQILKIEQIFKNEKDIFSLSIQKNTEMNRLNSTNSLVDWMGMNEEILDRPLTSQELLVFPEFVWLVNIYKMKPWIIPSDLLISNWNLIEMTSQKTGKAEDKKTSKTEGKNKKTGKTEDKNKKTGKTEDKNKNEGKTEGKKTDPTDESQNEGETYENKNKGETEDQEKSETEIQLELFMKKYLLFQFREDVIFNESLFQNLQIYCLLLRLIKRKKMMLSWIQREKFNLGIMPQMIEKISVPDPKVSVPDSKVSVPEFLKTTGFLIDPLPLSIKPNGKFLMYQTISISLVHKSKQMNQKDGKEKIIRSLENNQCDPLLLENILSSRRRRELRTLLCFNSNKWNGVDTNSVVCNKNKVGEEKNPGHKDKKEFIEFFIWPNYRLEDLACMNRYWFYTNNGSRFSMLRIHMYLPLKIK
uniref:Protein TIC 214 n=1 Tax=Cuscuta pedicellata TaxID=192827 RepID=A0A7H0DGZ0_9ASTE|nr:Ycf1 protein [Cuscuta pedicellata]QNP08600.1 Ycf1 protein [Cuscuta pedicellata]